MKFNAKLSIIALLLALVMLLGSCAGLGDVIGGAGDEGEGSGEGEGGSSGEGSGSESYLQAVPENLTIRGEKIPAFSGSGWYVVNGNIPFFTESEITTNGYVKYTDLDSLGRCGVAMACVGPETLPTDGREDIALI